MWSVSKYLEKLPNAVKALVVTFMALVFAHFVVYDLMSVSYFAPMEKASDFTFGDFYTMIANDRPESYLEEDVIIVPVDNCSDSELAEVIRKVDSIGPSAVGLDIRFTGVPCAKDSELAVALSHCRNLVMPVYAKEEEGKTKLFHDSYIVTIVDGIGGVTSVNIHDDLNSLASTRKFLRQFKTENGDIFTLPVALVNLARPEMLDALYDQRGDQLLIRYASIEVDSITPAELDEHGEIIADHIVLVGNVKDYSDMHVTPLGNHTPGLIIHALTVATILSGNYTWTPNKLEQVILGAMLCYIIVLINLLLGNLTIKPLIIRFIQLLILYLMIVGGTLAFIRYNVDLNFSYPILTVTVGVAACEIYTGFCAKNGLLDLFVKGCVLAVNWVRGKLKVSSDNENSEIKNCEDEKKD